MVFRCQYHPVPQYIGTTQHQYHTTSEYPVPHPIGTTQYHTTSEYPYLKLLRRQGTATLGQADTLVLDSLQLTLHSTIPQIEWLLSESSDMFPYRPLGTIDNPNNDPSIKIVMGQP